MAFSLSSTRESGQVGIGKIGNLSNICPVQPFSHRDLGDGMRSQVPIHESVLGAGGGHRWNFLAPLAVLEFRSEHGRSGTIKVQKAAFWLDS